MIRVLLTTLLMLVPICAEAASCEKGDATGKEYRVRGSGIAVYKAPSTKAEKVLNQKATSILGSTQYVTIDSSTKVNEECRFESWSKVRVVDPDWLRDSHYGWVESKHLLGAQDFAKTGFTEADFYWDDKTKPHKAVVVKGVNKIAKEDLRCRDKIDPGTASLSPSKSQPGKPVFFVTCGQGSQVVNVYFSEADLKDDKRFVAPGHIDHGRATQLCEDYAKSAANMPSTVKFSRFLDISINDHPNGRTTVMSSFSAKNAFGVEQKYSIRCLFEQTGLLEANMNERR